MVYVAVFEGPDMLANMVTVNDNDRSVTCFLLPLVDGPLAFCCGKSSL